MTATTPEANPDGALIPCTTCLEYLYERCYVVIPHLLEQARTTNPDAQLEDWLIPGTTVAGLLEAYVEKVHDRHEAGLPLYTPPSAAVADPIARLVAELVHTAPPPVTTTELGPPPRPCRRCRQRGRRKKRNRMAHVHPSGDVQ